MKLYLYTGEGLNNIIPTGSKFDRPALNPNFLQVHNEEVPYLQTRRIYIPEERLCPVAQVRMVEILLNEHSNKKHIQMFTHSPYVLDMAYWEGKRLGYEIKAFNVIFANNNSYEVAFEDPTGTNFELPWAGLNKAIKIIDDTQKAVEGE